MQSRRIHHRIIAVVAALVIGPQASAADLRPSWECLPDDTAIMVRMPQPAAFLDTLRTRTKFGAVALGADRLRKARALAIEAWGVSADEPGGLEALEQRLATVGLEAADLEAAFAGDMGAAVVIRPRGDDLPPLAMMLAWLEPGT